MNCAQHIFQITSAELFWGVRTSQLYTCGTGTSGTNYIEQAICSSQES